MEIDTSTRLLIAGLTFAFFAVLESVYPHRRAYSNKSERWFANLGVFFVDLLLVGIPLGTVAFGLIVFAETQGWGLMHWLAIPFWVKALIGFVCLDALLYFQHRLSHQVAWLWRLHRVHHADVEMDVSTANRIHPLESVWLIFLRVSLCVLLGIPLIVLVFYQIALNIISIFNHANIRFPVRIEQVVNKLLVTPAMHETHHSAHALDLDTNFAFILSCWDRWFRTYKPEAVEQGDGLPEVVLGIERFRDRHEMRLAKLLTMPFRGPG